MSNPIIIVGDPYNGLEGLKESLKTNFGLSCFDTNQIYEIGFDYIVIESRKIFLNEVALAFIRYPYDLIPPNSGSFKLREQTEALKTICLLLQEVSLNSLPPSWQLRNRLYSLSIIKSRGLKVPNSRVLFNQRNNSVEVENSIVKSIGNCFVSDTQSDQNKILTESFVIEEDEGDIATIFPAQALGSNFKDLIAYNSAIFLQDHIPNHEEYRVYIFGNRIYSLVRKASDRIDKSTIQYDRYVHFDDEFSHKLIELKDAFQLNYLCLDIVESNTSRYIVDVNPFGSFPAYIEFPEVTDAFASFINETINHKS